VTADRERLPVTADVDFVFLDAEKSRLEKEAIVGLLDLESPA
jgi:hypothetical protein